jgi:3-oxoadipate enol-lactonase
MPYLERAGQPTIHYELDDHTDPWKNAPTILLQHGYSRSTKIWYQWLPYLSRHYRILRTDLRGLGQSAKNFNLKTEMTPQHFVDDILAVINEVGCGPVHYCGESLGGIVGMKLAAEHADVLRTLTLVSSPLRISEKTKKDFACGHVSWEEAVRQMGSEKWTTAVNGVTRFPPGTDPELMNWYEKETGKSDTEVLAELAVVACQVDMRPYLEKIEIPTLGLYPSKGHLTVGDDDLIQRGIKNIRMIHMPTTFHAIQFAMPAACAEQLLHFAAQVDGRGCRE